VTLAPEQPPAVAPVPDDDALAAALRDPQVRASLAVIAANAPALATLVVGGQALLSRGPEITENLNGVVNRLRDADGTGDLSNVRGAVSSLNTIAPLAPALAARTDVITEFLDSSVLQPQIVEVIGKLGEAAMEADKRTRGRSVGIGGTFALLRQLKDPQVQQTLAFAVEFAKIFGERQAGDTTPIPPSERA
jgi:uncharacterized protein YjgD (DUF1641 family)